MVARVPWARHGSAYGFHSANALIALAMLTLGGPPTLTPTTCLEPTDPFKDPFFSSR